MNVLFAPFEIAGQMQTLANELKSLSVEATTLDMRTDPNVFGFKTDLQIPLRLLKGRRRDLKLLQLVIWVLVRWSVIHYMFSKTIDLDDSRDLMWFKLFRKKMLMHFHGSDIRNPKYLIEKNGNIEFEPKEPISTQYQQSRISFLSEYFKLFLVSTPDLLDLVKNVEVIYFPNSIKIKRSKVKPVKGPENKIIIFHPPSKKDLKGSRYVIEAVDKLKLRGVNIELIVADRMKHKEVINIYKKADIVVDQLLIGWYGLVSIEAMMYGKPVLCFISEDLKRNYAPDLPIVSTTAKTLPEDLHKLILDKKRRENVSKLGRAYVEKHHDSKLNARKLLEIYNKL